MNYLYVTCHKLRISKCIGKPFLLDRSYNAHSLEVESTEYIKPFKLDLFKALFLTKEKICDKMEVCVLNTSHYNSLI